METVRSDRLDGGVQRIALARPEARNAINLTMRHELEAAVADAIDAPDVHAILFAADGPHFSAGGDISFMQSMDAEALSWFVDNDVTKKLLAQPGVGAVSRRLLLPGD